MEAKTGVPYNTIMEALEGLMKDKPSVTKEVQSHIEKNNPFNTAIKVEDSSESSPANDSSESKKG